MKYSKYNKYGIMKGLAITGVVAGHAGIDIIEIFVNYWHLPVFFFISGYFLKQKHIDKHKSFILSRLKRLLIPFILLALSALFLHNTLLNIGVISGIHYGLSEYIAELKHVLLLSSYEQIIGAIWFLPALFTVSLFAIFVIKYVSVNKSVIYISGGVILIATMFCYIDIPSPFSIWQYISISWIFILGYYCSKTQLDETLAKRRYLVISVLILIIFLLFNQKFGLQASIIGRQSLLFPIVFIAGIIMINGVAYRIKNTKLGNIFGLIGDFSFSIMALHFLGFKFVTLGRTFIDDSVDLASFPVDKTNIEIWMPVYLCVGILFSIIISKLYSKLKYAWNNNCCLQKS